MCRTRASRPAPTLRSHLTPGDVAAALAWAGNPPSAPDRPPGWLLPGQRESFGRALAALRRHGVACVADPVGSGKTYVALAIAAACSGPRATVCFVPAVLVEQWTGVAARLGVPIELHTHERVSRGRLAPSASPLAIIDESHRFRVPNTRRYRTLAPWLVGRRALLLTGTPVVNRADDLLHQLRLAATDDTLAAFGVPSLGSLLGTGHGHPALSRLVIAAGKPGAPHLAGAGRPERVLRKVMITDPALTDLADCIDALRLSAAADVAALVRVGLLRALASSPAALREALSRYRALLRHAADAAASGRPVTRRDLRRAVGSDEAQLVLWALLDSPGHASGPVDLDRSDLPLLDELITTLGHGSQRTDAKAKRLMRLLEDGRRTIVFVTHRATVPHLRDALEASGTPDARRASGRPSARRASGRPGTRRVAWCTGAAAGIGRSRAARRAVLAAFDPATAPGPEIASPDVLVTTDVAAEGLNLQRAERIVHYDLPWTPMRLRQREGRAVRLGSSHLTVEVVVFRPPSAIELRLGMSGTLRAKSRLPARLGIANAGAAPVVRTAGAPTSRDCMLVVTVPGPPTHPRGASQATELIVAAVAHDSSDAERNGPPACGEPAPDARHHPVTLLVWRRPDGTIVHDPVAVLARFATMTAGRASLPVEQVPIEGLPAAVQVMSGAPTTGTPAIFADASGLARSSAASGSTRPAPADLVARLTAAADAAARARDDTRLALVDRALQFLRRGHTAGEAMLESALARCSDAELIGHLEKLPPEPGPPNVWTPSIIVAPAPARPQ